VDTRFSGEAFAWRHHLMEAGLNPELSRNGWAYLIPLAGAPQRFPVRDADIWLVSNIPALRSNPYRIDLRRGITFLDVHSLPNPQSNCPLLGMRALAAAGLKIEIDFPRQTVSVWVPASWRRQIWLTVRRVASGFATEPLLWG
jgi:hypothetical protein